MGIVLLIIDDGLDRHAAIVHGAAGFGESLSFRDNYQGGL
jgi:hypothetical protein